MARSPGPTYLYRVDCLHYNCRMKRVGPGLALVATVILVLTSCSRGGKEVPTTIPLPTPTGTLILTPTSTAAPTLPSTATPEPAEPPTPPPTLTPTPTEPPLPATATPLAPVTSPTPATVVPHFPVSTPTPATATSLAPVTSPTPAPTPVPASTTPKADVIFFNGHVVTMDSDMPQAEALSVKDEMILAVGDNSELLQSEVAPEI